MIGPISGRPTFNVKEADLSSVYFRTLIAYGDLCKSSLGSCFIIVLGLEIFLIPCVDSITYQEFLCQVTQKATMPGSSRL